VQQIALATEDIFRTVERLRANSVELLPIPENYYNDLEARTDLDTAQIDRLRAGNILYDRDGGAEFFQVYTRTLNCVRPSTTIRGCDMMSDVARRGFRPVPPIRRTC
jgi:4-hydroxyphenylpyruvate dioxygenase-like putative hemolysin